MECVDLDFKSYPFDYLLLDCFIKLLQPTIFSFILLPAFGFLLLKGIFSLLWISNDDFLYLESRIVDFIVTLLLRSLTPLTVFYKILSVLPSKLNNLRV